MRVKAKAETVGLGIKAIGESLPVQKRALTALFELCPVRRRLFNILVASRSELDRLPY